MTFKENLLKKIRIDKLAVTVQRTIGTVESGLKVDKNTLRKLLVMSDYKKTKERDLELYIRPGSDGRDQILVLDNELAMYATTKEDVALRKSPTVKEMISIKNAVKILNDKDVIVCKKADSLERLHSDLITSLDLSFGSEDLDGIISDGTTALEGKDEDGVLETIVLFSELLGYVPAPKAFRIEAHRIWGSIERKAANEIRFGPMVLYDMEHYKLKYWGGAVSSLDSRLQLRLREAVAGGEEVVEGIEVFGILKQKALVGATTVS